MINLAVFFGGESCEHDISIITGLQLMSKINEYLYNIIPIYINKNGLWLTGDNLKDLDNFPNNLGKLNEVGVIAGNNVLYKHKGKKLTKMFNLDFAILCLHGINGEDGSVAGVLNLSNIPYSSCDILSSSVCMDKITFNNVCRGLNLQKVDFVPVLKEQYEQNKELILSEIDKLNFPVIIKPSRQGSSIGIKICNEKENLTKTLEECFCYDSRLVVEKLLNVKKEVNLACFWNKNNLIFSKTEEPIRNDEFLNFNEKYTSNLSGMDRMKRIFPANIDEILSAKIKDIAKLLYFELGMFGIVRFDFLIDEDDNVFINEANTIPGSMANYLFKDDYPYSRLIEDIISNGLIRFENQMKLNKYYESSVLKQGVIGFKK